jgi:hypothetical protein
LLPGQYSVTLAPGYKVVVTATPSAAIRVMAGFTNLCPTFPCTIDKAQQVRTLSVSGPTSACSDGLASLLPGAGNQIVLGFSDESANSDGTPPMCGIKVTLTASN